ncbi:hypothetical protein J0X14_04520 [Muricauda sp. CAU 1633]|uniref:hypothetical protein n=1 Tax=Allomuricauda sp. CAU 1633 TaxID=2816036 RepID=UPI001A8DB697|nr:hypothetical protein [Muricauda sp. CAU 1633]MBO0321553.1 hypothetical protein [Muricauda sp. CAU 1633]
MATILLFTVLILILVDIFLAYEVPTHVAYILLTVIIVLTLDGGPVHKILLGGLLWFGFLVFHYLVWRRLIEKIHDKIIAPQRHTGGIEGLIGKSGIVKEIGGTKFILVNEELYEFENTGNKDIITGNTYKIVNTSSNKLII